MTREELVRRATAEGQGGKGYVLPVHMDLYTLTCLVGGLQLGLRHPNNTGPASQVVRSLIQDIIGRVDEAGYHNIAELMRLGENPEFDEQRRVS